MAGFHHVPVLLQEAVDSLAVKPQGLYADGTAGGGGHSAAIAARLTTGRLVALDRDPDALENLRARFANTPQVTVVQGNFSAIGERLREVSCCPVDGVLLDIGVSSHQLDTPERGFSYHADAPLDMRMSRQGPTAADLVNGESEEELARLFFTYGEEPNARRVAAAVVRSREKAPITTTGRLAEVIAEALPAKARRGGHPARRCFQALRIAVNDELGELSAGLDSAFAALKPGGRLAVITFHSLEDRMVKRRFAEWCRGCICPPDFPVCVCGRTPAAKSPGKYPITASAEELAANPRARSAKLRTIEKSQEV